MDNVDLGMFDLSGKTACVTGASSGLGRRTATILADAGAQVVGVARRRDALQDWHQTTTGDTAFVVSDLTNRDMLAGLVETVNAQFGPPDIVVHAAGINTREPADDVTSPGWDTTLELNLSTAFFLSQQFVGPMKSKGWGRIVNFASLQSFRAFAGGIAYGASKGGVAQMTRAMAEAWSRDGINVNAIAPGFFRTELTAAVFADQTLTQRHADQTCIGRNGEVGDIDGPILFLCSDASAYVTGQVMSVDGGYTAK
jgi:NAD(P)-dependent dehydrogenase (short-subunit alcohol dehydrogenase family)